MDEIPLKSGRIGLKVKELQKRLCQLAKEPANPQPNLEPLLIDEIFGRNTENAIKAFQASKNLVANGEIWLRDVLS